MTQLDWLHFFVFSSLALNLLLTGTLSVVWWKTKDYGKVHYITRDRPGVVYVVRENEKAPVKYVGITTDLKRRVAEHKRTASYRSPFHIWFNGCLQRGVEPYFEVIEECTNRKALAAAEKAWIAKYKSAGFELLNSTNGG